VLTERAPQGFAAPPDDRWRVEAAAGDGAAAYGELLPESAAALLRWLRPGPRDAFFDLGSGTGKLVLQAACTTEVGLAVGIELSRFRHRVAQDVRARLLDRLPRGEAERLRRRARFRCEDFTRSDLTPATIAWAGATCFPEGLLLQLARRLERDRDLRAFLTTRPLPDACRPRWEELGRVRVATSWSRWEKVFAYGPRRP
jgi:SAM-dependent methyltransferase